MSEYAFLLPISLFLLLGVMSPGPSFILVVQTAMAKSRSAALAVALGLGVGATCFALLASAGLFSLLAAVPTVYLALKVAGGLYLCFLAVQIWRSASAPVALDDSHVQRPGGLANMFLLGLVTQLSNPKTAIVFGSAFAAFLPAQLPDNALVVISGTTFVIDAAWYVAVALLLSTQRPQRFYRRFKHYICKGASTLMGGMGLKLIMDP
ncbi:LysE family translocator [Photobacterium atrarenae]|uniref:LysE family transporter n=1 Tax=Photobacterium atrarenae TaxID=865757 RepID=A0ABY5GGR5_9GAMM|nr:LysE family transporter [Photobacterium atrarenae]UTV28460.1 LysE family transporter [Photobacterium atrarenae]